MRNFVSSLFSALREANRRRLQQRRQRRGGDYGRWVRRFDTLTPRVTAALCARLAALRSRPKIALVLLAHAANGERLMASIASVKAQIYPHWELLVALDAHTPQALQHRLALDAARDERIRLVRCEAGAGTGAALCAALAQVSAQSVGLLGDSDTLAKHALLLMAEAMERHPHAEVFYSDEDELDARGQRCNPHFKCDWNPELLLCSPYLRQLTIYRTALVRRHRDALAQVPDDDAELLYHELALRCTEALGASGVVHVPHVLCHSRAGAPVPGLRGAQAVRDRLQRIGLDARVDIDPLGGYRLSFAPPTPRPLVSIVIPTRDRLDLLQPCIASVLAWTRYTRFEIIVVDNGSEQPQTLRYLEQLMADDDRVRVLRDERPFNYAELNNLAVAQAEGEFIALLNNDTEVISSDWLGDMLGLAALPGIGAVGARLWYDDMSLQHAGVVLGLGGVAGHAHRQLEIGQAGYRGRAHLLQAVSAVTAACLLVRKATYLAVGGLDQDAFAVAYNDVDFCLRLRAAGFRNVWTPNAELFHYESKSRGNDLSDEHIERYRGEVAAMLERWGLVLKHDPAYSPNLSLDDEAFGLAWPPRVSLLRPWFDEPAPVRSPQAPRHEMPAAAPSKWRAAASMASRS